MVELSLNARLEQAAEYVRSKVEGVPEIGLVLGSGLGALADTIDGAVGVPYSEIPHMPSPTVSGHAGKLVVGKIGAATVACLQGRVHLYEGHAPQDAVFAVRLLATLGCGVVLITNAAGGVNSEFEPGTLMLIKDHLNLMGRNPLTGPNDDSLGTRFPDMTVAYDEKLGQLAQAAAVTLNIPLAAGIYAAMLGPSYETPAEIHMLRTIGADAVGMSTVPEVIALRHLGARVGAISCITNMAAGMSGETLNHAEVKETAARVHGEFVRLIRGWVKLIAASND